MHLSRMDRAVLAFVRVNEEGGLYTERELIETELQALPDLDETIESLIERGELVENDVFVTTPAVADQL